MEKVISFQVNDLKLRVKETLQINGVNEEIAECVTNVIIDAEVRGHASHGVGLLPVYLKRVKEGGIKKDITTEWISKFGSIGILDAKGGFGQVAALEAATWCSNMAIENGIAAVGIRNNNHIGMLAAYRKPFQDKGVVGLLLNISGPSVSAPGTIKATLGSNTFCLVTPTSMENEPFVVDLGTGVVSAGKIRNALAHGEQIPKGWLKDKDGKESIHPEDLDKGGSIPLFGQYKGLGVSIIAEVLAGMLGGKTISPYVNKQRKYPNLPMNCSQLFIGISKYAFELEEMDSFIQGLKNAVLDGYSEPPKDPFFPNQVELNHSLKVKEQGIVLPYQLVKDMGWV